VTQYTFTISRVHAAIFDNHPQPISYVPCSFRRNNVHLRKLPSIFVYDGYRKLWVSFRVSFADTDITTATSAPLILCRKIYASRKTLLFYLQRHLFLSRNRGIDGNDVGCKCVRERERERLHLRDIVCKLSESIATNALADLKHANGKLNAVRHVCPWTVGKSD